MKRFLMIIFCLLGVCGLGLAQQVVYADKSEVNSIKRNSEYLNAEAANLEDVNKLIADEIKNYCHSENCDKTYQQVNGDIVTVRYKKSSVVELYFSYIHKKLLFRSDADSNQEIALEETTTVGKESVPPIADSNSEFEANSNSELISEIRSMNDFSAIYTYLSNRKKIRHDIQFKAISGDDGTQNCYWIVFDGGKKLIAVLDKSFTKDLLNNKTVRKQDYINYPKIWLQTY